MKVATKFFLLLALSVLLAGCSDLETTDQGGVILKVQFVNVPGSIGVNDQNQVLIPTIQIDSVVQNPTGGSSSVMDVLVDVYEVTFSRADTGTRTPPAFVYNRAATVPVGGTLTLTNFPIMGIEQMRSEPISDLLFENGGVDRETGATNIRINATFTVFGRTVSGESVASEPRTETIEFITSATIAQ